jgi:hypothetical protein
VSAKQLHNAHYQSGEVTIRYGFHPRCGETVVVTGRNRRDDEVALTIRQPDGTRVHLPIWMTEEFAETMRITEIPRLSLPRLRELRVELDACLSLLRDDSCREEGDKYDASATEPSPIRPVCAQDSASTDSSVGSDEAVAAGEYALDRDARRRRSDGGKR